MKILHPDWKWIAAHSWSFWLMGITAVFEVGGMLFPLVYAGKISIIWFAGIALVLTISAMIARLAYQRSLSCEFTEK